MLGDSDGLMLGDSDGDIDLDTDGDTDLDIDEDMDGLKLALVAAPTVKLLAAVQDP